MCIRDRKTAGKVMLGVGAAATVGTLVALGARDCSGEDACESPKAAADVIATLFRRELDTHQTFFAMGETLAHLNYLVRNGTLARTRGADGVARYART